ncbi:MAG: carbamoyl transferase, partial [Planctomycetes bacterium]|nr:carbamoyl transferase [Planctomycetota bacterium]
MLILGFNSTHDASAALVQDGRIVAAIEEERLTRAKHQGGFPRLAIDAVLRHAGASVSDLDAVTHYWNPWAGLGRFAWHLVKNLPGSLEYFRRQPGVWGHMRGLPARVRRELGYRGPFHHVNHHEAHAASTFYPSSFDEAAILTLDGTGEWTTTLMAFGRDCRIERVAAVDYPHSLGKVYEALTQYLGFRPMSGEGKVMGLAPFGQPRYLDLMRRIIQSRPPLGYQVDTSYFAYHLGRGIKYSPKLVEQLGPPREAESEIDDRHRDVAASLQARLEEVALDLARSLRERTGARRLCLAGGVAFNSVMNGRILRE